MKTLVLFLFASGFRITTGKVTVVQTCPKTKTAWDHRSSIFSCEDGKKKYHCVMTSVLNLVEVCITPLNITGNEKGCPLVYIFGPAAYWEFPFTSCPVQNTECPQNDHGGYTSEELYKYPSCFRNISERISGDNTVTQTTTGTRVSTSNNFQEEACISNLEYLPYTTVATFLLIGSLHVFILLMYLNLRRHVKEVEVLIKEGSNRISQISSSSSGSLPDLKESDKIPYTRLRTRQTRPNSYVPYQGKKDIKVNADSRKGTSSTENYESHVEKDMKGKDVTPLPHSDTTNYANYPVGKDVKVNADSRKGTSSTENNESHVEKDMKGKDVTPLPDSDTTNYANCPVGKDVKVRDDPRLPVSDVRKGNSSTSNYKSPVQKDMKGKDVTPLPDSDTTNYANYPVGKDDDPPVPVSDARKDTSSTSNYKSPVQKVDDDPPVPVSDARKDTSSTSNYKSPVQKDVKVNDDPSLPVSDSRKGTSSRAIYERPVQKVLKGNVTIPLSDNESGTRATYYENYPVQKERTEQ